MKHPIPRLTPSQREQLLKVLTIGGDLVTVCQYVGATPAQLRLEMKRDPEFAQAVARAEATAELNQMTNVVKATKDEKNWRTSVWWIERRTRQRLSGDGQTLSEADIADLIDLCGRVVIEEFPDPELQRRVIERLYDILARDSEAALIESPVGDSALAAPEPSAALSITHAPESLP